MCWLIGCAIACDIDDCSGTRQNTVSGLTMDCTKDILEAIISILCKGGCASFLRDRLWLYHCRVMCSYASANRHGATKRGRRWGLVGLKPKQSHPPDKRRCLPALLFLELLGTAVKKSRVAQHEQATF